MRFAAVLMIFCLLLVGCSMGSNTVTVEGSTSVEQVLGFLAEGYELETDRNVNYNPTGSSAGIESVLEGRCDIGVISRELTAEESEKLKSIPFAIDTIVLVTNRENSVSELSSAEIFAIFTGEITNWKELGGNDHPIVPIGRESGSGTRNVFETVTDTRGKCLYQQELTSAGDVITAVGSNRNAIGYTSLEAVKGGVSIMSVDGVQPTGESLRSGEYRLRREFLFVTAKNRVLPDSDKAFLDFVLSQRGGYYIELAGVIAVGKGADW